MKISEMASEQLKKEFISFYEVIYVSECYGVNDLLWLDALEAELEKRGYVINFRSKVSIKKADGKLR